MIGRGTRLCPGKQECLVIDVCDNSKHCSLVTLPSLLGLPPAMDLHGGSVTEAAETIEAAQTKYPGVDFTNLSDISNIKAFIESIDLFAAPYTPEVTEFSKLAWVASSDGSYILAVPERESLSKARAFSQFKHEKLHITPNELDEFVLSITSVGVDKQLGIYTSLKEAFESADEVTRRCRADRVKLLLRESEWHAQPASEPAKALLRKLSKKTPVLRCLCPGSQSAILCPVCRLKTGITAGEVSTAINLLKARRAK